MSLHLAFTSLPGPGWGAAGILRGLSCLMKGAQTVLQKCKHAGHTPAFTPLSPQPPQQASSLDSDPEEQGREKPQSQGQGPGPHPPGGGCWHVAVRLPHGGHRAETEDTLPKHHQNNSKLLPRTSSRPRGAQQPTQHPCDIAPTPPHPWRGPAGFLPGTMETVSFSQDTTLTYSCTEEGMRHLKTAMLPRMDR